MYALLKHKTKHLFAILISTGLIALVTYLIFIALNITSVNEDNIITEKTLLIDNHSINLVYFKSPKKGLVIYISDSNFPATAEYAKKMAELSYYVANIDSNFLLSNSMITKNNCLNIAEKILNISHQLQKTYSIDKAELPILVGNNEGATLVYIALAQADITSFHAGVSINFAPQIATKTSFCQNINDVMEVNTNVANSHSALNRISSSKHLGTNWYIFQNTANAKNSDANNFIAQINNAKLAVTESTTNNSGIVDPITEAIQILQWLDPRLPEQVLSNNSDSDLPLIEVPVKENQKLIQSTTMAVLLTGDGGWAEIDKNIAKILAEKGVPTVALDALSYFWRERTPETTAKDINDVISQYRKKWNKQNVILIGYSFGADVLPFIANKLSEQNKASITLIALLGMGKTASFEFRLSSWMNADTSTTRLPVLPELKNMQWANSICIYGTDDKETGCILTSELGVKTISMAGDHHFNENYNLLVQHIIENIQHPPSFLK